MNKKEAMDKLDVLIGFFDNYNKMLSNMEKTIEREMEVPLAA